MLSIFTSAGQVTYTSDKEDTSKFWKSSASGYGFVQDCLKIGHLRFIQQTLHSHQQVAPQNSV